MKTLLTDLDLSEVSLVDKGANPGAKIMLYKREVSPDICKAVAQAAIARSRLSLMKNAEHDQSSHGNRAGGSSNPGRGFHGTALEAALQEAHGTDYSNEHLSESDLNAASDKAAASFDRIANELHSMELVSSVDQAKQFLDSRQGRHLGDQIGLNGSIQDASQKTVSGLIRQWRQGVRRM